MVNTHSYVTSPNASADCCCYNVLEGSPSERYKSHNLHVLIVQDGYLKASKRMIAWLETLFPGNGWAYLSKLKNTNAGKAQEDPALLAWFAKKTKGLFRVKNNVRPTKSHYLSCACGHYYAPSDLGSNCPSCSLHLGPDPLVETALVFQTLDKMGRGIPTKLMDPAGSGTYIEIMLTLLVKCRNRQKHDSHWWALNPYGGFMQAHPIAEFAWLTDCGTLFHYQCLHHLLEQMKPDNVAAATGRQRVMSPAQQGAEEEGFVSRFLRHVQRCDFELSFGATMGSFSWFGFLPVLPGPCGLYKLKHALASAPFYHDFLSMNVGDIGVVDANLMIAEDRVLSWAVFFEAVPVSNEKTLSERMEKFFWDPAEDTQNADIMQMTKTQKQLPTRKQLTKDESHGVITSDVRVVLAPEAIFYFESECLMQNFVKQRRRWLNGTLCGYLWLLYKRPFYPTIFQENPKKDVLASKIREGSQEIHEEISFHESEEEEEFRAEETPALTYRWRLPWRRLIPIYFLIFIQIWMSFWVYLGPAIFIGMFRFSLSYLAIAPDLLSTYWWIPLIVGYIGFIYISTGSVFHSWTFYLGCIYGMVIEIMSVTGIGISIFHFIVDFENATHYESIGQVFLDHSESMSLNGTAIIGTQDTPRWVIMVTLGCVILIMALPVLASVLACPKTFTNFGRSSFWYILTSGIPYVLFLPTMVAIFGAFSLARLFDFTWGNRDSGGSTEKLGARLETLQQRAKFASPFFLTLNLATIFLLADFSTLTPRTLLALTLLLFGPPLCHFALSFCYFLCWRIGRCCRLPCSP